MKTSSLATRHALFVALCVSLPLGAGCKKDLKLDVKTPTLGKEADAGAEDGDQEPPPEEAAEAIKTPEQALSEAVASPARTEDERARDKDRHPNETLAFFRLTPEMTVVELEPYDPWYSRIIAGVVAGRGKFIATSVDPAIKDKKDPRYGWAADYATAVSTEGFPPVQVEHIDDSYALGDEGSVDLVISVRNEHGFVAHGVAGKVNKQVLRVLKPGGYYGVVAHRAKPKSPNKKTVKQGYLTEASVIERITKAGFELVGQSEINANPNDTKDYKRGVWALPPTFAAGEKNRDKYAEIGESDRMTLLFRKPSGEPASDPESPTADADVIGGAQEGDAPEKSNGPGSLAAPTATEEVPTE